MVQHVCVIFTQAERLGVAVGDRLVRVDGYEAGENYPNPCSSEKASQNGEFVFVFFLFFLNTIFIIVQYAILFFKQHRKFIAMDAF